jgi:hypothetical protein
LLKTLVRISFRLHVDIDSGSADGNEGGNNDQADVREKEAEDGLEKSAGLLALTADELIIEIELLQNV